MTTDGLIDQIGGEKRRGFGKKRFKKLILELADIPMDRQAQAIVEALREYQRQENRREEVAMLGFNADFRDRCEECVTLSAEITSYFMDVYCVQNGKRYKL